MTGSIYFAFQSGERLGCPQCAPSRWSLASVKYGRRSRFEFMAGKITAEAAEEFIEKTSPDNQ
jgi:hypothetical protein